jgi:hypothetical protein
LIVAALALGLYAAATAWVVQSEGRAYRRSLGERTGVPQVALAPADRHDAAAEGPAAPAPAPPIAEAASVTAAERPDPTPTPTPPDVPAPTEKTASSPPAPATPPALGGTAARLVPRAQADPFWELPAMKESWDIDHMSADDERRLGQSIHEMIMHFQKSEDGGPWARRVEEVAEPLKSMARRQDVDYQFTILDSDVPNAFSHPGGYIYVTRGLFNLISEDEDYMLQFVVGHEMAHIDLGHALGCLRDPGVKQLEMGTLAKFYLIIIPFGYLDRQDFEADRWVFDRMARLDRTRRESLGWLRRLDNYAEKRGFANRRGQPEPERDSSPLDNHIRAHVIPRARLKQLDAPAQPVAQPRRAATPPQSRQAP